MAEPRRTQDGEPGLVRTRTDADQADVPDLTLVFPLHNERSSLALLVEECRAVLDDPALDWSALGLEAGTDSPTWELIFVDDGSSDGSFELLRGLSVDNPEIRAYRLRRNLGKAAALSVGFSHARGEVVVTLDADLQDDPREIPRMLKVLALGYDLVSGWKRKRHDSQARVVASKMFNMAVRSVSGIELHDLNCGFKAYRNWVVRDVRIYGELHRFIPVIAAWKGYAVGEIEVQHRPRRFGRSRYGWGRAFRGMMDLVTVMFLTRFDARPAHFFSLPGAFLMAIGFSVIGYVTMLRLVYGHILQRHPLLIFGVLVSLAGLQLFTSGLLGEMLAAHFQRDDDPSIIHERIE
ncbi:MAG: glycosyltransferase family 2 protein [Candidatus Binatia bacterium]|nr:glycosyltransferase family 2 protein [Candidatus Binatia bacterium]